MTRADQRSGRRIRTGPRAVVTSTIWLVGFFLAGWWLGEGAVEVLDWYAKIAGYVAIGLIVVIVVATVRRSRAKPTAR